MVVITTKKPVEEVLNTLKENNVKKIFIVSCGVCAALCQTGGTEGLAEWKEILEKEGFNILNGKLKRVIIISSFVVICVSAVLASATQTSVETMYRDITSVDAVITMQMVCGECDSQNRYQPQWSRNIARYYQDHASNSWTYNIRYVTYYK